MSDLLITVIQFQIGPLPMQTIAEWANTQLRDAKTVLLGFAAVAILGLTVYRVIKSGFSLGSLIMAGVVAALALWLVGGGIDTISTLFDQQAKTK